MPEGWAWDESLFAGSSVFYDRGRIPYPVGLRDAFADVADLRGSPRLIDVGCGPGTVALRLADLFAEVVGVDADRGMIEEATRLATRRKLTNERWLRLRAEALPAGLGTFRYATFAQSFHWMDRELVATRVFVMLEHGGAFEHDLRVRLTAASDAGFFSEPIPDLLSSSTTGPDSDFSQPCQHRWPWRWAAPYPDAVQRSPPPRGVRIRGAQIMRT